MSRTSVCWLIAAMASILPLARGEELAILPPSARLDGPGSSQRFVVERVEGGVFVGDASSKAMFRVSNPNLARVEPDGTVVPLADGTVVVTAKVGEREASATVEIRRMMEPFAWSFRNHVLPVMTRTGCNQGACHGAAAGKNGFKLTLRGYGPETDHDVLTRQATARRIIPGMPHESLFLLKPTGVVDHGGGVRLSPDSLEYRVLAEWIAQGTPGPRDDDPTIVKVEALPKSVRLKPGDSQQVIVRATWSNGREEDVTRWAKFDTTDATVAKVDEEGRIRVEGRGEAAVSVWYANLVDLTLVASPSETTVETKVFAEAPRRNRIDELNLTKLEALGIPPSPMADDATFLRRAYLDATGTLPPAEVVDAFLADGDPEKRAKLVDRLLDSPEYVDYWAYKWSDLFLVSSRNLPTPAMWAFYRAIRQGVAENRPWDDFARRLVTAKGSTLDQGLGNYFVIHRDPIELTENLSVAFLGLAMTCARCHNHPMEKWTQDQYYGMANLFARVKLKDGERGAGDVEIVPAPQGEVMHPRRGVAMKPQPLDGEALELESRADRREAFADWLVGESNPYFAKAVVNRVWANFFGRGLIDPEDDLRATNPPSDPALMDWLVDDLRAHKYDVKHLIRTIMTSAVYARSSDPVAGNEADTKYLSHYPVKRLGAEVLLDAIARVTGVASEFAGYPVGYRSLQLPDSQVASSFLSAFGRPPRESTCSCERSDEPNMSQALHLANGGTLNEKLRRDDGAAAKLAASDAEPRAIVEQLFRAALGRLPRADEIDRLVPVLAEATAGIDDPKAKAEARRQAVEDLYWATLTSKEFLFNH